MRANIINHHTKMLENINSIKESLMYFSKKIDLMNFDEL